MAALRGQVVRQRRFVGPQYGKETRRLDAYASTEHTTPTEGMRRALDEYVGRIGA